MRGRFACVAAAVMASLIVLAGVGSSTSSAAAQWRMRVLVPASRYVWHSQLAVAENGDAVVGWLQGRGPKICFDGCAPGPAWHGYAVRVARGTAAGGFHAPVLLSAHAAGGLYVAQVSSGTSYVAWTGMPLETSRWRVVAIRHGRASAPTLLGAGDQLVGLFSGHSRHVAAVWIFANGRGFPIRYAWLDSRGRLGRKITIATMRGSSTGPQIAVNDRGQLAAAWVQGQQHPTGVLVLCQANGRCASPRHLTIPNTSADAFEFDAVTLADDGTATALITASAPGDMVSFGLWGIVTHVGRHDGRLSMIAPSGYFPVATASGRGGAVAMFSPTADTLAWTFMRAPSDTFSQPTPVPDDMTERSPLLAANLHGEFVAAWSHFTRFDNPTYELRATTGVGDRVGATTTLAGGNQDVPEAPSSVGIDGHGNAIITWEQFSTHGAIGLFDATHAQ